MSRSKKPRDKTERIYEIVLESNRIKKDWLALKELFPERMDECEHFLTNNPEDRSKVIGILKKLRGRHKGTLQYDITKDDYRVWYWVNKKDNTVIIKYAGAHPD